MYNYLKLDAGCWQHLHSDGDDAFIFQPIVNYRTLEFDKALKRRSYGITDPINLFRRIWLDLNGRGANEANL